MGENFEKEWTVKIKGAEFICFEGRQGEIFHFRRNQLRRGLPRAPWRFMEEMTRPLHLLTVENCFNMTAIPVRSLQHYIHTHQIPALKKTWRYGRKWRCGYLIDEKDLKEFVAKKMIEKYKNKIVKWGDTKALDLLK